MLPDAQLPNILTADWQADEANAGKTFPSYARMLQHHGSEKGNSRYSWTIDFAGRRAKAREDMQPLLDEASTIKASVVDLKEQLKRLKKDKADKAKLDTVSEQINEREKAAKELENKAADIDSAVFDLKAVNPHVIVEQDTRTPLEIIEDINANGRIITKALTKLSTILHK